MVVKYSLEINEKPPRLRRARCCFSCLYFTGEKCGKYACWALGNEVCDDWIKTRDERQTQAKEREKQPGYDETQTSY